MTRVVKKDDGGEVRRVTWVGLAWNVALTLGKFAGGVLGGSQALVADAIHSASDFVTDIAVIVGSHFWNMPPDAEHPYGHRRFETLVTMGIGISVAAVGVGLGYGAIMSLLSGEGKHPELLAAIMALASIVVKEILFHYTRAEGRKIRSQALEANAWHHRSDAFSSIPVLIAVVISLVFPQLWFADAVGALIVAFFVLRSAYEIASPGAKQLVDQGADEKVAKKLLEIALGHAKVMSVHGDVAEEVEQLLIQADENVVDALVHVDPYDPARAGKSEEKE